MDATTLQEAKVARPDHPVLDVIKNRWSPRAFSERPVEEEKLRQMLEAARWAPSSYNEQPWRFLVATAEQPEAHDRLLECLTAFNQGWAKSAPVLMLTVAKKHFSEHTPASGKPNRHALHDVGLAMGGLTAQATALGLFVHQMAGIRPDVARQAYGIPEAFEPVAGVAVGYLGNPEALPEKLRRRERSERTRRPLRESIFARHWETPAEGLVR